MALDEAVSRCKLLATNQDSDTGLQGDSQPTANPKSESTVSSKADSQLENMIRMMAQGIVSQVEIQGSIEFPAA